MLAIQYPSDPIQDYFSGWRLRKQEAEYVVADVEDDPEYIDALRLREEHLRSLPDLKEGEVARFELRIQNGKVTTEFVIVRKKPSPWTLKTLFTKLLVAVAIFATLAGSLAALAFALINSHFVDSISWAPSAIRFVMTVAIVGNLLLLLSSVGRNVYKTLKSI